MISGLYTDFYELTMAQGYFASGKWQKQACFDYFFRTQPFHGGYAQFAGLQDLLDYLPEFRFGAPQIDYLKRQGFADSFLNYLEDFQFTGTMMSVQEGETVFPNEPILRVEGNILETQLLETLVLNFLNFETLIATKARRLKWSAGERTVIDFGLRRAQGLGGIHASRAAILGGVESTSNVFSAMKFDVRPTGTMAHSWVESFESELEAFRVFARIFPERSVFLVDTYDTLRSGVPNAITVAKEMESTGHRLRAVRLDSGDLAYLSKQTRAMLDKSGLKHVQITVSNQLDEHIIKSLLEQGAPIDVFGVGTSLVTGKDDAALDGVYKLSEFDGQPKLKISENIEKVLLPGRKKIFRYYDSDNNFFADAVLLVDEHEIDHMVHPLHPLKQLDLRGLKKDELLRPVWNNGSPLISRQSPYLIADFAESRLEQLPPEHKRFEYPHVYKVGISDKLRELRDKLIKAKAGT